MNVSSVVDQNVEKHTLVMSWHGFFFFRRSAIFHVDRQNNSSRCLLRRLPRTQDAGTPSNSTGILEIS
jgi:hypothetical protein